MVRPPALPVTISLESVDAISLTLRQRMVECRCQEGKRPATVPSLPDRTYADEGWARNRRWRHLGNVPCVSRVQSVRHHPETWSIVPGGFAWHSSVLLIN
jgi:hypothetical protein